MIKLGLLLIVDSIPLYARFYCPNGDSTFSVHDTDEGEDTSDITLCFICNNLDEKIYELKQKGVKCEKAPTDQKWLWREAHLRDPDTNKIILYHAGTNNKTCRGI